MKHRMHLNADRFDLVKEGLKTIEVRLYDEKRKNIKVGDTITMIRRPDGKELEVEITDIKIFRSFGDAFDHCDVSGHCPMENIGYPGITKSEYETIMEGFYPDREGGAIVIFFKVIGQ